MSSISPPNTRQSVKNKNKVERIHSPPSNGGINNGVDVAKKTVTPFPTIPNLPSGLTIERVSPSRSTPDSKICIVCKQPGK